MSGKEETFTKSSSAEYDQALIQMFAMNGRLNDAIVHKSKVTRSWNNAISNWNGAFCCVVAISILLLNGCLWFYFLYKDSIN